MHPFVGQYQSQKLANWESVWGGGNLPAGDHGECVIVPGSPMVFSYSPGGAWDTFYQLQRIPTQSQATECIYHIAYQSVSDAALTKIQAIEGEMQRNDGTHLLNGGFQFDLKGSKTFNTYDFSTGKWIPTPIPSTDSLLLGGKVLDVVVVYDLLLTAITYRGVQINGTWNTLGIQRPYVVKSQQPYFNYAWQVDCTSDASPNAILIPQVDITIT